MKPWKPVYILVLAGSAFFFRQRMERHHTDEAKKVPEKDPHQTQLISCLLIYTEISPNSVGVCILL